MSCHLESNLIKKKTKKNGVNGDSSPSTAGCCDIMPTYTWSIVTQTHQQELVFRPEQGRNRQMVNYNGLFVDYSSCLMTSNRANSMLLMLKHWRTQLKRPNNSHVGMVLRYCIILSNLLRYYYEVLAPRTQLVPSALVRGVEPH